MIIPNLKEAFFSRLSKPFVLFFHVHSIPIIFLLKTEISKHSTTPIPEYSNQRRLFKIVAKVILVLESVGIKTYSVSYRLLERSILVVLKPFWISFYFMTKYVCKFAKRVISYSKCVPLCWSKNTVVVFLCHSFLIPSSVCFSILLHFYVCILSWFLHIDPFSIYFLFFNIVYALYSCAFVFEICSVLLYVLRRQRNIWLLFFQATSICSYL